MAAKKTTKTEYVSVAKTTEISATSRVAVCVKKKNGSSDYYTIEAMEKRSITDVEGVDMDKEWSLLFDAVNSIVDAQAEDIISNVNGN